MSDLDAVLYLPTARCPYHSFPLRWDEACAGLATTPVIHPHEQEDRAAGSAMSFVLSLKHRGLDPLSPSDMTF